jgi:hypothetical protein
MPEHDHPSSFRASASETYLAAAARQVIETRDRAPVMKCTQCALSFIGTAVPPLGSVHGEWVCPICLGVEPKGMAEPDNRR